MGKKNALRTLKRHRRVAVLERAAFLAPEVQESKEARNALKRRKLVARP
jgi:hypothetical protein